MRLIFVLTLVLFPVLLKAQTPAFIEGKIMEKSTGQTIPYSKVQNKTLQRATLSNEDGYFKIPIGDYTDTVMIQMIGYKPKQVKLNKNTVFYDIYLEENAALLGEVTVRPEDNFYLYKVVQDCRKSQAGTAEKAKMYYELKSYVDSQQIELVENFYNGRIVGYDLESLQLKTGRFALRDFDKTFFGSMESSKAITMLKLFKNNDYFASSPFELTGKKLREAYHLRLLSRYLDELQDSIYVVEFVPRDTTGRYFSGRAWIDPKSKNLHKLELECKHVKIHPFLPIFKTDTIRNLDLQITKSFGKVGNKMCFQHIDFAYETTYKNRSNTSYKAFTRAVLYAYDYEHEFIPPRFEFPEISDYKKINAVPYNRYFWKNHEELKLSDQKNQNELFFIDTRSTTSRTIFSEGKFERGLLESPYLTWGGKRIRFREFSADTTERKPNARSTVIVSELYNLSAKIYLDIIPLKDTLLITTTTVMDPYASYYKLPLTNAALCFINIYFDLIEMERRKLEAAILASDRKTSTIDRLYYESEQRIGWMESKFFKEVDHGLNQSAMEKWNQTVYDAIRINNIGIFEPYKE